MPVFVLILIGLAAAAQAGDTRLSIVVDPRIEVMTVIQRLAGYDLLTRFETPYRDAVDKHFEPHRHHETVKLFRRLSAGRFNYDAVPSAMLSASPIPELKPLRKMSQEDLVRAGGREGLEQWLEAVRRFVADTKFQEFFESQKPLYDRVVAQAWATMEGRDYIATLEGYYRQKQASYTIVLSPLVHNGGFGPRYANRDGTFDVVSVLGPGGKSPDGTPVFGTRTSFEDLVWHEFGHSFVNPEVERHSGAFNRSKSLYEPIAAKMKRQAYGTWQTSVNEHIVRAVTVRLQYREMGESAGKKSLDYERNRGFRYIDALVDKLKEFETDPNGRPFRDFVPELADTLAKLAASAN